MTYAAELMFNIWAEILPHLTSTKKKKKKSLLMPFITVTVYTLYFLYYENMNHKIIIT